MRLFGQGDAWVCSGCGSSHSGLATVFGPDAPDSWHDAPPAVRNSGGLTRDQCDLEWQGREFTFIRGHIVIPIMDRPGEEFVWSVWSTLTPEDRGRIGLLWDSPDRARLAPMPGRLANALPYEPDPTGIALLVQHREPGVVPRFTVSPESDHPLAVEQRDGITWHRVAELNQLLS